MISYDVKTGETTEKNIPDPVTIPHVPVPSVDIADLKKVVERAKIEGWL